MSGHQRLSKCGRSIIRSSQPVGLHVAEDVAHYSGLQSCGSIWVCPVCAPRIREERAHEIEAALALHLGSGGGAAFLTLTMPHDWGDSLRALLDGLMRSWGTETGSRGWREDRAAFGVVGFIRSMDLTVGPNGWHPHLHVLLLTERPLTALEVEALSNRVWPRWERAVQRAGYRAPVREYGLNLQPVRSAVEVSAYTAKVEGMAKSWGVGREITRGDMKGGHTALHRGPFALALDAIQGGEARDVALWREYVDAMHGRRAIEWSRGLRERLGLGEERSDEEIAAEEVGGELVATFTPAEWCVLLHQGWDTLLLDLVETDRRAADVLIDQVKALARERGG